MRGRKPKPAALKELEGNPGKRAINPEPKFSSRMPRCPEHLTGEARKEWKRVVHELHYAGLLKVTDRAVLAAYCQAWADWVEACRELDGAAKVCTTDKGYEYPNPWIGIRNGAMESLRKMMAELGMTPSSRSRVKVDTPEVEDPFERFVRKKLGE